jgi:hypothetical protein
MAFGAISEVPNEAYGIFIVDDNSKEVVFLAAG